MDDSDRENEIRKRLCKSKNFYEKALEALEKELRAVEKDVLELKVEIRKMVYRDLIDKKVKGSSRGHGIR